MSTADKLALMQKLGRGQVKPNHPSMNAENNHNNGGRGNPPNHGGDNHGLPAHIQTPQTYSALIIIRGQDVFY